MKRNTILANIPPVVVDVLKLAQGLDDVDILSCPRYDHL